MSDEFEDFNIDLNDTKDVGAPVYVPVPAGEYPVKIVKKPNVVRAKTGDMSPMLSSIQMQIDAGDEKKHMVFHNLVIHSNTAKGVKEFLLSFGFRSKILTAKEIWTEDFAQELVGRDGLAQIGIEPDLKGMPRNVVKYWVSDISKANQNRQLAENAELLTNPDEMPF